jgi:hypothetical protein
MVLNPHTDLVSPQFHVGFDDTIDFSIDCNPRDCAVSGVAKTTDSHPGTEIRSVSGKMILR